MTKLLLDSKTDKKVLIYKICNKFSASIFDSWDEILRFCNANKISIPEVGDCYTINFEIFNQNVEQDV